jgi:subtilisin family serine protease
MRPGKRRRRLLTAVVVATAAALAGSTAGPASAAPAGLADADPATAVSDGPEAGRVLVVLEPGVTPATGAAAVKAATGRTLGERLSDDVHLVEVPPGSEGVAAAALASRPGVAAAVPDSVVTLADTPDDPCFTNCNLGVPYGSGDQWGLGLVGAPSAWDTTTGAASVAVAVVDTGVQSVHPDLAGKVVGAGCSPLASPTTDPNGHGTFVAGIIAAATNNGTGVASLGRDTQILSVKALNGNGEGLTSHIVQAVACAVDSGARVVNLSIEKPGQDAALDAAIAAARARGAVVVAAAGNFGLVQPAAQISPANSPGAISVAATRREPPDALAPFSSHGTWVDMAAPGEQIVSTCSTEVTISVPGSNTIFCPGGYATASGTSFASPLVAAAAALLLALEPGLSAGEVESRLERTAATTADTGGTAAGAGTPGSAYLCGRLDAARAVRDDPPPTGYWMVGTSGTVHHFGAARDYGPSTGSAPPVGLAAAPSRCGYWTVDAAGVVQAHGQARGFGDLTGVVLGAPIVAMAATISGDGYWLLGRDGGIFAFGDAQFLGSTSSLRLNAPVTGIAPTPTGRGYWLVAQDGGIFAFGDARFFGSTGGLALNQPVFAMAPTPDGDGYWLAAFDGGIFAFGDARFAGSTGALVLNRPIVGMAPSASGDGYWLAAQDGGIFAFGDAAFAGSLPGAGGVDTVVALAAV